MEFLFAIDETVSIEAVKITGIVIAILVNRMGVYYDVRYFDKAEAREVYFMEKELKKAT